jgi:hypothetical protein
MILCALNSLVSLRSILKKMIRTKVLKRKRLEPIILLAITWLEREKVMTLLKKTLATLLKKLQVRTPHLLKWIEFYLIMTLMINNHKM